MPNLAILGYGKMGRLIEQLAPEYDFSVSARIDIGGDLSQAADAQVAIEFTQPDAVAENIEKLAAMQVPVNMAQSSALRCILWLTPMNMTPEAMAMMPTTTRYRGARNV